LDGDVESRDEPSQSKLYRDVIRMMNSLEAHYCHLLMLIQVKCKARLHYVVNKLIKIRIKIYIFARKLPEDDEDG